MCIGGMLPAGTVAQDGNTRKATLERGGLDGEACSLASLMDYSVC